MNLINGGGSRIEGPKPETLGFSVLREFAEYLFVFIIHLKIL